jgi:hypothetical protein
MKQVIAIMLLLSMTATVSAQDVPVVPNVPEVPLLTPMEVGDKAPYKGVLLSPPAIADIIAEYKTFGDRLRLEIEKAQAEERAKGTMAVDSLKVQCDTDRKVAEAQVAEIEGRNKVLIKEQKRLERSQRNLTTWTVTGVALGLLVGTLGTFGVVRLID